MTKKKLMCQIRKEFKAGRIWTRLDDFYTYKLMFDTSDGAFWVDVFTNSNDRMQYHSETIKEVPKAELILSNYPSGEKVTIKQIEELMFDWCLKEAKPGIITD